MNIKNLGLAPATRPVAMREATYSAKPSRRVNIAAKPKVRPSENPDPAVRHRAGGLIGELSAGTVMVDHAARGLHELGLFRHEAKQALGLLKAQSDKLLAAMQSQFDGEDADATNYLSDALGLLAEKFCQLTPAQMDAILTHADNMIASNMAYVPAATPYNATL